MIRNETVLQMNNGFLTKLCIVSNHILQSCLFSNIATKTNMSPHTCDREHEKQELFSDGRTIRSQHVLSSVFPLRQSRSALSFPPTSRRERTPPLFRFQSG